MVRAETSGGALLAELRGLLRDHYGDRIARLVLFGSRARGDASPDSDYDVLVVLRGTVAPSTERRRLSSALYGLCFRHDAVLSCHFVDEDRYETERSPFFLNVRREGLAV